MTSEEWETLDELARGAIEKCIADKTLSNNAIMFGKSTLKFEEVVQGILNHHWMSQHVSQSFQGEVLVAKTEERGRSNNPNGNKGNKGISKSKAKDGCFECWSKGRR
ncbi:hypothetical protein L3X38_011797 [Prunus dulcis]|uniref:Uncharacterized protein n=1 Tax=Prunus dulcis TaxID=3755 RepID=A0AAD4WKI1_PRUDU|nr:hypothetical protein L3X38_011797 [Prunus dulcis]